MYYVVNIKIKKKHKKITLNTMSMSKEKIMYLIINLFRSFHKIYKAKKTSWYRHCYSPLAFTVIKHLFLLIF